MLLAACSGGDESPAPAPDSAAAPVTVGTAELPALGAEGTTTTSRVYNANGLLESETVDGVTTSYTYDPEGNVATVTRPGGKVTTYSLYVRGVAQREDHPEGVVITREVDHLGNVVAQVDGELNRTVYERDEGGQIARVVSPEPASVAAVTIRYFPDPSDETIGIVRQVETSRGASFETLSFDGFGRVVKKTRIATDTAQYDPFGRLRFQSNPGATTGTTYTYDYLGRVTELRNADGSAIAYAYPVTANGIPQTQLTDERGHVTTRSARELIAGAEEVMRIDTPVADASIQLARNVRGQVTAASQGGVGRSWGYDTRFYLTTMTAPETGVTTIGRDAAGNMTSLQVGSSGTTYFDLDDLYRVEDIRYPDPTRNVHQVWDRNGRLKLAQTATSTRTFAYDKNGNRKEDKLVAGGQTFTIGYTYNTRDHLTHITYPISGASIAQGPDRDGRQRRAGTYTSEAELFPIGVPSWIKFPNKVTQTFGLDTRLRPQTNNVTYSNLLTDEYVVYVDQTLGFDLAGNVETVTDASNAAQNRVYGYDAINRLTSVAYSGGAPAAITYDGAGNIRTREGLTYTYDASTNRLAATTGTHALQLAYDARGNVTSTGQIAFQYDDNSRLRCARCGTAQEIRYDYDGLGMRISRTQNGKTVYEIHDLDGRLLVELDPATGARQEHVFLGDLRVATNGLADPALGKIVYYHNDAHGTPIAATDANGALLWTESFAPYGGRRTNAAAAAGNRQWFHGKQVDPDTGMADFGARNYDARLGRFLSIDPVDYDGDNIHSLNRYAYGNNNPIVYRDPDGHNSLYFDACARAGAWIMSTRYGPPLLGAVSAFGAAEFGYGTTRKFYGTFRPLLTSRNAETGELMVKVLGDEDAYTLASRMSGELSGLRIPALFKGAQPEGTGAQLLAKAIKEAGGLKKGDILKLENVVEEATWAAYKAGATADTTKLARSATRALNKLNLIAKDIRWAQEWHPLYRRYIVNIEIDVD